MECRVEPVLGEAGVMFQQPEAPLFSWGSCPWILGPWQWRAAQPPRKGAVSVTCAHTEASWWRQQQP